MRSLRIVLIAAAMLALVAPAELWAQGRGKPKAKNRQEARIDRRGGDRVRDIDDFDDDDVLVARDARGRVVLVHRGDIQNRFRVTQRRGQGPPFCRNGAGHPVHGRQWCIDKGWGLGTRTVFFDDDRVILRSGNQFVVARARDDRSVFERIVDRILFLSD